MKKIIIFIFVCLSFSSQGQNDLNLKFNKKQIKFNLAVSGIGLCAGALTDVIRTYKEEPDISHFATPDDYNKAVDKYAQNQKDMHRISSMFYGISGVFLIGICFNF